MAAVYKLVVHHDLVGMENAAHDAFVTAIGIESDEEARAIWEMFSREVQLLAFRYVEEVKAHVARELKDRLIDLATTIILAEVFESEGVKEDVSGELLEILRREGYRLAPRLTEQNIAYKLYNQYCRGR